MISDLHVRTTYRNKNIYSIIGKSIIEYDMKEAGFSLIQHYKLLPEKTINFLLTKNKEYRTIFIGKQRGKDKEFSAKLTQAFKDARKLFFVANEIEDNDIVSIHNDALFISRVCNNTKYGEYIDFRIKNQYTSYMFIDVKNILNPLSLEVYYSRERIDIKGMDNEILKKHNDGFLDVIRKIFSLLESGSNKSIVYRYIRDFKDSYVKLKLPVNYYRNFDRDSNFTIPSSGNVQYDNYFEDKKENIDILHNILVLSSILKIII